MFNKIPESSYLHTILEYKDGLLYWKIKPSQGTNIGDLAGSLKKDNHTTYRQISIDGKHYQYHRIIYKMFNPEWNGDNQIDHIKHHDIADNRIENLRQCNNKQNQYNQKTRIGSTSIYKGVSWEKDRNKWRSQITINRKTIKLGRFSNEIDAAKEYDNAAIKHFGEYAMLNFPLDTNSKP